MHLKKIACGLFFAFGLIIFSHGQQANKSPECLKQASDYKNSVFILIDPGHGCNSNNGLVCLPNGQPGAQDDLNNATYSEACMTTDLALRVRNILRGIGLDVGMTRDTNTIQDVNAKAQEIRDQILSKRNDKGDNFKPYFISIHFNGGSTTENGNFGIYAHSSSSGESVANIVSNAQGTTYLDNNNLPVTNIYPAINLLDNQNNLFDALQRNIRLVLGGTYGTNTIQYDSDANDDCPARPSYKSLGIYRSGLFPLLSGWYAQSYNSCDPDYFSGNFTLVELPNLESIPVKHSLQEVEFITSPSFLKYLKRRQFVAIAMAWAITENIINEYINGGGNADCMRASMYNDSPDDNSSNSSGNGSEIAHIGYISPIIMPFEFLNRDIIGLFNKVGASPAVTFTEFTSTMVKDHPVFVIPAGLLGNYKNNTVFKLNLEQYVKKGGTIIVLGQQYGGHVDNVVPIPEGESLHTYGWREDQSCMGAAGYFNQMHPILASQTSKQAYINVDGYFSSYPGTATILLRRVSNQQPCLISYPYGNGTVILTSMYTDWGAAHSQASISELRLVRDLVTYARNPNLPIPMYNLTDNPHPDVSLNVTVKNDSEAAASKAKLKIYTPDRRMVLYETETSLSLDPGAEGIVPVSFNLGATLTSSQYGLCHTDYELYDSEGDLIQIATEADSGRFGVHVSASAYVPSKSAFAWLTVEDEDLWWDEPATFTLHVRNNTGNDIHPNFEGLMGTVLDNLTI